MASLRENASIMRAPYSPLTTAARSSSGGDAYTPRVLVSRDAWPAELSSSSRHRDRERDRERASASSAAATCCSRSRMIVLATLALVVWLSLSLWWCLQGCARLDSTNGGGGALTHTLLNGNNNIQNQLQVPACTPQPCEAQECPACPVASASQATAPSSAESEAERRAEQARVVSMQNVLPFASTPGDSTGSMLILHADDARTDAFTYEMCSFTRVCAAPDALYLFVQKREEYDRLAAMFEQCVGPKDKRYQAPDGHYSPCHCFYPQMAPRLLPFFVPEDQPLSDRTDAKSLPDFSAPSFLSQTRHDPLRDLRAGHTFLLHKFVRIHHIAHWAQKVVFMQSMMRHAQRYFPRGDEGDAIKMATYAPEPPRARSSSPWTGGSLLQPWTGMAMIDMDLPLTPHESFIFNASLRSILEANPNQEVLQQYLDAGSAEGLHPLPGTFTYAQELDELWERYKAFSEQESAALLQLQQYSLPGAGTDRARQTDAQAKLAALPSTSPPLRCFERLSWNRNFGVVSSRAEDTAAFRRAAYASIGADLSRQLERRCPPRKVVLLYRSNRVILNWAEVVSLVKELTGYTAERMTIDGNSSPEEQVRLFASAGLLISSHSSQLINVLFSHPSSALIEASSEFFNADFAEYAHGVGVFFRYALGGVVEDAVQPVDPGIQACTDELSHCEGSSYCILIHRAHCPPRHAKNKNKNFHANLTALRVAVTHAKNHLNWACDGLWSKYEF